MIVSRMYSSAFRVQGYVRRFVRALSLLVQGRWHKLYSRGAEDAHNWGIRILTSLLGLREILMASVGIQESEVFSRKVEAMMLLELKDVDSGGSLDLEEAEGDSEEVVSLNSDSSAFKSIGGPPQLQEVPLKKSRSKRTVAAESTGDGLSGNITVSQKRKSEKKVLPTKATKKVWDKEVDNNKKKFFVKEDQRLIKLLGLKQRKHLVLNGEDSPQKVNFSPPPHFPPLQYCN